MAHDFKAFPELTNRQMQFYYFDSPHRQITEDFTAQVVDVHDGDTVKVRWSERDFDFRVRLLRIAAPELNERGGLSSQRWLASKLAGKEVTVQINPFNRVGKFGRILGEIIVDGININQLSLDEGHSIEFDRAGDFTFKDDFNIGAFR
tara:strand:- start:86 stop:529 length:444 start_codon:yes stop_codon:yes gene_type:complete